MSGRSQKEIADLVDVSENTISKWAKSEKWEAERSARMFSNDKLKENKMKLLVNYTDRLLKLENERERIENKHEQGRTETEKLRLMQIQEEIVKISDAASKIDKKGSNPEDKKTLTLVTYLDIMDEIFSALEEENPKLYQQTIDFQERHTQFIVKKLG